jgi:LysM repeat protein
MAAVRHLEHAPDAIGIPAPHRHLRLVPRTPRRPSPAVHRRRRVVVGVVVGGLLVIALKASAPATTAPPAAPATSSVHVVQPGETYWSIATSLDGPGPLVARVDELVAANGGEVLQPGDRLQLPG